MTSVVEKIDKIMRDAELQGGWASYAVYCLGDVDSGDAEFDQAIADLYVANERVHRIANTLALRFDLELFEGE